MIKKNNYSKKELIDHSEGILNGMENGKLPQPPMLMIDRIININDLNGKYSKGSITAELDIEEKNYSWKSEIQ